ncbi:unnamed protein product [Danaus chrysippus]|uniref:(African queen) hypothetical protein n=1 Tax=Danaus chrysippus TaxID=151541 RepID=A0A8J2R055_9NEOP|nr:unnamed protein product [Danaus chrysippus]
MCVYCGETFEDTDLFRSHMEQEHTSFHLDLTFRHLTKAEFVKVDISTIHCRICARAFESLEQVAAHLKLDHRIALHMESKIGVIPFELKGDKEWICSVCSKNVPSLLLLSKHTVSHFQNFVCDLCGKSYISATGLLKHVKSKHQDEYKVHCRRCRTTFSSLKEKICHQRTVKHCMPHVCMECPERFPTWETKQRHLVQVHDLRDDHEIDIDPNFEVEMQMYKLGPELWVCALCETRLQALQVHCLVSARNNAKVVLKYSTAYPFRIPSHSMVCVYCCEAYDDPKIYRQHMEQEHSSFNVNTAFAHSGHNCTEFLKVDCTELSCRICEQPFNTIDAVAEHLSKIHEKNLDLKNDVGMQMFKLGAERWVCAICNIKLPSLRELSRHTSCHYHRYTCETCGKSYINKENLQRHIQFVHSKYKICIKCKKTFPTCEERREHVLSSERCWPQSCSVCGKRFVSRNLKLDHLAKEHGHKPKSYTCPECGIVFDKWHPYRAHFILAHTNDNYSCSHCGLKFDRKKALEEHKVMHTKEKSFHCGDCGKSFARKKNLVQHSWIHSEYKRFECTSCNKSFNQRVSWKTHMKSYHPELVDF